MDCALRGRTRSVRSRVLLVDGKRAAVVKSPRPGVQKSVLDTTGLAAGQHTLSATVADRYGQSAEGQITFTVQ